MGESGVDTGGLERELWRLLRHSIVEEYCIGSDNNKTFKRSFVALRVIRLHLRVQLYCAFVTCVG